MVFNACSTQFYSAQFVGLELLMLLVSARKLRWAFTSWKMQVLEEMWHVHVNLSQETKTVFACEALCHFRISVFLLSTQDHDRWHSSRAMRMSLNPLSHIEIRRESPALQSNLCLLDLNDFAIYFSWQRLLEWSNGQFLGRTLPLLNLEKMWVQRQTESTGVSRSS